MLMYSVVMLPAILAPKPLNGGNEETMKQQLHAMTKAIVQTAKAENKGIVMGDLSHKRQR
ncbi:MAG: hypothetical protein ACP5T4_00365 [Candidatus Micrarchaeia archaeon]